MNYKILESRLEFRGERLHKVIVLVDCTSNVSPPLTDVRAISAKMQSLTGRLHLWPSKYLSADLLQEIAAYGSEEDEEIDKIFPNWKTNMKN